MLNRVSMLSAMLRSMSDAYMGLVSNRSSPGLHGLLCGVCVGCAGMCMACAPHVRNVLSDPIGLVAECEVWG